MLPNQAASTSRYAFNYPGSSSAEPRSHSESLPPIAFAKLIADAIGVLQGKYKYNAWKKIVDEKVTPEQAQTKYVDLVEKLKKAYGFEA